MQPHICLVIAGWCKNLYSFFVKLIGGNYITFNESELVKLLLTWVFRPLFNFIFRCLKCQRLLHKISIHRPLRAVDVCKNSFVAFTPPAMIVNALGCIIVCVVIIKPFVLNCFFSHLLQFWKVALLNHPLHFPGILHHKLSICLRKRPIFWISNNLWHLTHQLLWRWLKQSFNRSCLDISFIFVFLFAENVKSVNHYLFLDVNQFFINQLFRSKQRQNLLNLRVFRAIFT